MLILLSKGTPVPITWNTVSCSLLIRAFVRRPFDRRIRRRSILLDNTIRS